MVGSALAAALRAGRMQFNQVFRAAQQQYRGFEAEHWLAWLEGTLDPVAEGVAAVDAAAVGPVVATLYKQSLPLVAKHWLGPLARESVLDEAYRRLLTGLAAALARDPERISASLFNALHQLCQDDPQRAR